MVASADPVLLKPAPAYRSGGPAVIQYVLKSPAQSVRVEILDAKGQVIRSYPDTTNAAGGRGGRGRGAAAEGDSAAEAAGRGGRGRGGFGGNQNPGRVAGVNTFMWDQQYAPA